MQEGERLAQRFEEHRTGLTALARRMLGSSAEADDAVQETWLRLSRSDADAIENLGGWLRTVLSRVCLNVLEARRSRPEVPFGDDGLEPAAAPAAATDPEHEALLAESVGLALHLVLDRLAPAERVAFVLHDMFGVPFEEIARIVDRSAPATRQLASRARRRIRSGAHDRETTRMRQAALVDAFLAATRAGDFAALLAVLDPDAVLRADEQAVRMGAAPESRGAQAVAEFCRRAVDARPALLDGAPAVAWVPEGQLRVVYAFTVGEHAIDAIDLIADPVRLRELDLVLPEG